MSDPLKQTPECELDRDNAAVAKRERLRQEAKHLSRRSEDKVAELQAEIERLRAEIRRLQAALDTIASLLPWPAPQPVFDVKYGTAAERERRAELVVNCYGMTVEEIAAAIRKGE